MDLKAKEEKKLKMKIISFFFVLPEFTQFATDAD